tara:strand:- start:12 stop:179 length:168 start_codon:yes stop_codon:yes gene_type:complete
MGHEAEAAALERAAAEQRAALQRVLAGSAADSRGVVEEQLAALQKGASCSCLRAA